MKMVKTILCTGMLALAPMALAEEFSNTPKSETLQQAIQFEKHKLAAAEAQARKDAAEARASENRTPRKAQTARKNTARKTGQADTAPKQ